MTTIMASGPIPPERGESVASSASGPGAGPAGAEASAPLLPVVPVVPRPPLPGESVLQVPRDTTPTWELEMLVSGAVLYGLFQLPPLVDSAWRALSPRFMTYFAQALSRFAFLYVKASVYALTLTFVVHLASRAYWVALVGVDSVFPGGIRWEKASFGPIARELILGRIPPLSRVISRLDNFCSVAFAVGFVAVSGLLSILVLLLGMSGLAWAVARLFFGGRGLQYIFTVWILVIMLPVLALLVDRRMGTRLRPDGWTARVIRAMARLNPRVLGLGPLGPLSLTLITNLGARRVRLTIFVLLTVSLGIAATQFQQSRSGTRMVYPGLPLELKDQARQYRHYADQRNGADAFAPVPFIQSDVVQGPYVRLFIPYVPAQHEYELAACRRSRAGVARASRAGSGPAAAVMTSPGSPAGVSSPGNAGPAGAAIGSATAATTTDAEIAVLCLGSMYDVTVNGRRLPGIDYRYYTDAASGLEGLLGYVPTAGLPRGGNELTVRQPRPDAGTPPAAPYVIPFWL